MDRMTTRSFRHMIQKGHCDFIVARTAESVTGYVLVLYRRGSRLARLYSFAVLPEYRGRGIGELLLKEGEKSAASRGCNYMRLEVNTHNRGAIRMYEKSGYQRFGTIADYYEDHADALRYQKYILNRED